MLAILIMVQQVDQVYIVVYEERKTFFIFY